MSPLPPTPAFYLYVVSSRSLLSPISRSLLPERSRRFRFQQYSGNTQTFYGPAQRWPRHGPFNGTMDDVNVTEGKNFASRNGEALLLLAAIRAQRLNSVTYERVIEKSAELYNFHHRKKK